MILSVHAMLSRLRDPGVIHDVKIFLDRDQNVSQKKHRESLFGNGSVMLSGHKSFTIPFVG